MKKITMARLFLLPLLLLAAAASSGAADTDTWRQELLKEREQKDIEFKTSVTSPMAGGTRLTVGTPGKTFITIMDGTVSVKAQAGAGTVFTVFFREGKWYWDENTPGILCRLGERNIARNVEALIPGSLFKAGRFTLAAYPGPESLALIVFDPQRPQQLDFKHLLYFPPDARYAVPARLEKFPEKREVKITTTRKLEKTFSATFGSRFLRLGGRELGNRPPEVKPARARFRLSVHSFQGRDQRRRNL